MQVAVVLYRIWRYYKTPVSFHALTAKAPADVEREEGTTLILHVVGLAVAALADL